jgi:hypothetical protein
MTDLLHHVRVVVALYDNDMEALPGGDNDPVPSWDDVMREFRKAVADADGSTQEEQEAAHTSGLTDRAVALIVGSTQDERGQPPIEEAADTSGLREALDVLDVIDGIVDDTHPEGDGCPLCTALDDLRAALEGATERPLDVDAERLAEAMRGCDGVAWPKGWREAEHNFDWVARQVAAAYRRSA